MTLGVLKNLLTIKLNPLNDYVGVNLIKRETPLVVSISCSREEFKKLPLTLYSLLNQDLKPDRIVLYLDNEYEDLLNLPYEISKYIKNGLEIKFVDYIGSYTKTIYAMKEFTKSIIVTADESTFYNKSWLKNLYLSYVTHPEDINVNQALQIVLEKEKICISNPVNNALSSFENLMLNSSGVLYPPNCFNNEVFRKDIFLQNSINENVWFWTQALISNRKIRVTEKKHNKNFNFKIFARGQKQDLNVEIKKSLDKLLVYYKNNILNKLK